MCYVDDCFRVFWCLLFWNHIYLIDLFCSSLFSVVSLRPRILAFSFPDGTYSFSFSHRFANSVQIAFLFHSFGFTIGISNGIIKHIPTRYRGKTVGNWHSNPSLSGYSHMSDATNGGMKCKSHLVSPFSEQQQVDCIVLLQSEPLLNHRLIENGETKWEEKGQQGYHRSTARLPSGRM